MVSDKVDKSFSKTDRTRIPENVFEYEATGQRTWGDQSKDSRINSEA